MAAAVTGQAGGLVQGVRTPDTGIYAGKNDDWNDTFKVVFAASGVAADQVDLRYIKRLSFTASTQQTINLSAAVGDDGITVNFARVRVLAIRIRGSNDASTLKIDNAGATNPFTGFLNSAGQNTVYPSTVDGNGAIKNSGFKIFTAPNTTGAVVGSGVNLRLLPSAHAFDVDVVILGCSA